MLPTTDLIPDFNAGDTVNLEVILTSPVDPFPALDLTGSRVYFAMRRNYLASPEDPDQLTKELTSIDVTEGDMLLSLAPADTIDLAPDDYYYEFFVVDAFDARVTVIEARFRLLPCVIPLEGS